MSGRPEIRRSNNRKQNLMKMNYKIITLILLTVLLAANAVSAQNTSSDQADGFLYIPGGSFLMGSPESENWRIEDEVLHEVTVLPFYIDPFETTQEEYERLMGGNWLDGKRFGANVTENDLRSWIESIW